MSKNSDQRNKITGCARCARGRKYAKEPSSRGTSPWNIHTVLASIINWLRLLYRLTVDALGELIDFKGNMLPLEL
jgi:hypothetical protein